MTVRQELAKLVERALREAQEQGALPSFPLPSVEVTPTKPEFGDYSTSLPLQLARMARMAPMRIAEAIREHLPPSDMATAEVTAPGFLNFRLKPQWVASQIAAIEKAGRDWTRSQVGEGRRVQVEFVSANPTGPLHFGGARNAVLGDTMARVLDIVGYQVQREYYVNDAGTQMRKFGESLYARYAQLLGRDEPMPEDGYMGQYMVEYARRIVEEHGDTFLALPREEAVQKLTDLGLNMVLEELKQDLAALGVRFDNWFSERSLYEDGTFERVLALLREKGLIYEKEGALWFAATQVGGPKDEVLVRSSGEPGYFASDIAYHYNKFVIRGFDWVIDVWAVDHQGHVPRMKAVMKALGVDPDRLTILLYNLVTLKRHGEEVKLSKRAGDIITLREVLDEVGPDPIRFMLLTRSNTAKIDFDLALAVEQSQENPVYYVQYAHTRIAGILRKARAEGWTVGEEGDLSLLTHPSEQALLKKVLDLPDLLITVAERLEPHHLTYYAQELATHFHAFYRDCRVIDPEAPELTQARLRLVAAVKLIFAHLLEDILGMTAPEVM
ncbi:MAG: arginine--tRNA ligase [Chloroflexi bacterium]|nr:arginine--tRNA ligase [Chloroflexota bacterium]